MSNYIAIRDGGKSSEEGLMKPWQRLFSSGVPISYSATSLQVTQRAAGANMSVDVAIGDAALATTSYIYWGWSDAVNNVVIAAADPTNPRIDALVAYVDLSVVSSASNNNPGALKFVAVAGTAAASPVIQSDAAIQASIGAGNPFIKLSSIAVAALAGNIVNANITDLRTDIAYRGTVATSSWSNLNVTPTTTTALGNRSYSQVYNGVDLTGTLSVGMRLKETRTVAAPTQCTSLNGTTQFFSKTSPNKLTFTDDFVVSAWVKLSSYASGSIATRLDANQGWVFNVNSSGQLVMAGYNAAYANSSSVTSYQSVPLNKWIHVTAQLDMSSFTATTTTSYVMIDGVDVPCSVARTGTNPTTLVQAGTLQIGAQNGGNFFTGKIAQVAIYNAKVTQATILASMNQTLTGSETAIASAYSFNNSITDLNTTTPNDLTANGSAVATTADSPFAQGVAAGSLEYGIATSIAFSTNTTVTVQVPEGSALPTSGGISAVSYSGVKVPYGFPADEGKWDVLLLVLATITTSGVVANTTYNPGGINLNVPIGDWILSKEIGVGMVTNASLVDIYSCLSTSASALTIYDISDRTVVNIVSTAGHVFSHFKQIKVKLTTATPYYVLLRHNSTATQMTLRGDTTVSFGEASVVRARIATL